MPRRELLTPAERAELFAFPADEGELIRLATLSKSDLAFIRQHRGLPNRLGVAVQMVYLRHPGRALGVRETPHARVLELIAAQLDLAPADWDAYAVRSATRREHLAELSALLGMAAFDRAHHHEMIEHVLPVAVQTTQGMPLAQALIDELRRRRIELPPMATLERLCAGAATRAQRQIHQLLVAPLNPHQRDAINKVLDLREGSSASTLAWLRQSPGKPSAKSVLAHIERLTAIRQIGLPPDIGRDVPLSRVSRIAREGAQTAVYQIQEYETERRLATMVAILVDTVATITDEILNLHDRLIGSFFTKDKNRYERRFADDGKALNEKVRLYAQVGSALIGAKEAGSDPFTAIEGVLPWERFTASVRDAERLARDEEFDSLALLVDHFSFMRRYAPTFLETFEFRGAPIARELLAAVDVLREMNRTNARKVPADAPVGFVRPRWKRFVFADGDVDRRYYEFAVMSELKNALRGGDVWVPGSRQFKDFDEYLLPRDDFNRRQIQGQLGLPVPTSAQAYLDDRLALLRHELDVTNKLAAAGELPDVEITERGLKISPIEDDTPDGAEALRFQAYHVLPRVKITELLLEVDQWTNFSGMFSHLKTGEEHQDRTLLLTAILADAFNLGLEKMAEACPGTSLSRLSWLVAWHIRDETYSKALAKLVDHQHRLPMAAHWGEGTTSSSDGQRFRAGGHGEAGGYRNAKYGDDPGVLFYTHISDQVSRVSSVTARYGAAAARARPPKASSFTR